MIRFLLLFLLLPFLSAAQIPKAKPNTYVNDYTGQLTNRQVSVLNEKILQLERVTSVQLEIVLVDTLPSGMKLENFAREIGNKWGIGDGINGLVYLISIKEQVHRLAVSRSLESILPDSIAHSMINKIALILKNLNFYQAIDQLTDQVIEYFSDSKMSYNALQAVKNSNKENATDKFWNIAVWFILAAAIGSCIWAVRRQSKRIKQRGNGVLTDSEILYFSTIHNTSPDIDPGSSGSSDSNSGFSGGGASDSW